MNSLLQNVIDLKIDVAKLAKVWQNNVLELSIQYYFIKAGFNEVFQIKTENVLP